jgi:hypothetical protein
MHVLAGINFIFSHTVLYQLMEGYFVALAADGINKMMCNESSVSLM